MITKNYIKMCKKAGLEKNENYKVGVGDTIYILEGEYWDGDIPYEYTAYKGETVLIGDAMTETMPEKYVWLPTQEQLQETLLEDNKNVLDIFEEFWYELKDYDGGYDKYHDFMYVGKGDGSRITTLNELWLAFVMKEKYNKVWNGKKWEKA